MDSTEPSASPKTKLCVECASEIPVDAKKCPVCDALLVPVRRCVICAQRIPLTAKRCNGCDAYQNWRRSFPLSATVLSLLVALIAVLSPAISSVFYIVDYHSHTEFRVTGADETHVYLKVWNTGRRPSTLVGYRLICDAMPYKSTMLRLSTSGQQEAMNVIGSGSPVKLSLAKLELDAIPPTRDNPQYTDDDIGRLLPPASFRDKDMRLIIDVEESSNKPGSSRQRCDRFPAARIADFITARLIREQRQ